MASPDPATDAPARQSGTLLTTLGTRGTLLATSNIHPGSRRHQEVHLRPRLRSTLAGIGVVALLGVLPGPDRAAAQPKPIKIGEINSYSGVATVYTFPYKEGLAMAAKEINDAGGVLGRPLEFIHRDDKLKPDEAVKAARELTLQDKVDFLAGCIIERGRSRALRVRQGRQGPLLRHALSDLALTWDDGHRYVAHTTNNVNQYVRVAAKKAATLPIKKWANISPDYEYGHNMWESSRPI
jgi:branched-chain amino acid transport system substrate-binding protein